MAKKLLVVDDEPQVLLMLKKRLEKNGYEVITAKDGAECVRKAKSESPNLIVLDILMPDMDGTEAATVLKRDPKTRDIPVFFLTALKTKNDEKSQGEVSGENTIFAKPFDPEKLVSSIREMIGT